jgi:hypothetical protein
VGLATLQFFFDVAEFQEPPGPGLPEQAPSV